jgi:hypothetical protein
MLPFKKQGGFSHSQGEIEIGYYGRQAQFGTWFRSQVQLGNESGHGPEEHPKNYESFW